MNFGSVAQGQQLKQKNGASGQKPTVEGWDELMDSMRDLPSRLLARLPKSMQDDPQIRQEVARLALAGLATSALDTLSADDSHPFFLPQLGLLLFGGQANADTIYRYTHIAPGGTYRLRGHRGNINIAMVGEMSPREIVNGVDAPTPITAYHDINALKVDDQGRFDVILSPTRPKGYTGDWWQLKPDTFRLLMRLVRSDIHNEREPTVSIERLDAPAARPRPSAAEMEDKLRKLPREANFISSLWVDKTEALRQQGFNNKFKAFDVSGTGGLVGQFYYEGSYEIGEDEALIIESKMPKNCHYRSIMVVSDIYDYTIDWYNNQTTLNGSNSQPDSDGVLRYVLSERDPGVPNWLATAGYRRGLVQGRWTGCDATPIPTVRKVAFSDVHKYLPSDTPKVTPQERDRIIRDRRSALQQRSLW